jgi:hypothetical protein
MTEGLVMYGIWKISDTQKPLPENPGANRQFYVSKTEPMRRRDNLTFPLDVRKCNAHEKRRHLKRLG